MLPPSAVLCGPTRPAADADVNVHWKRCASLSIIQMSSRCDHNTKSPGSAFPAKTPDQAWMEGANGYLQVKQRAQGNQQLQAPVVAERCQDVDESQPRLRPPVHRETGRPPGALLCLALPHLHSRAHPTCQCQGKFHSLEVLKEQHKPVCRHTACRDTAIL